MKKRILIGKVGMQQNLIIWDKTFHQVIIRRDFFQFDEVCWQEMSMEI